MSYEISSWQGLNRCPLGEIVPDFSEMSFGPGKMAPFPAGKHQLKAIGWPRIWIPNYILSVFCYPFRIFVWFIGTWTSELRDGRLGPKKGKGTWESSMPLAASGYSSVITRRLGQFWQILPFSQGSPWFP